MGQSDYEHNRSQNNKHHTCGTMRAAVGKKAHPPRTPVGTTAFILAGCTPCRRNGSLAAGLLRALTAIGSFSASRLRRRVCDTTAAWDSRRVETVHAYIYFIVIHA